MAKTEKKSKSKKKNKTAPKSVAMKNKSMKVDNPFETIWSRRKFDILGKKRKGEEVRIGLARSLAIQKRNKTLLKEYEQSGKSSVFIDNRIGERNNTLGEFDKAIMRSQRQRQSTLKANKKSKYNLSDGEDDDLEIQGLGERDDFEDDMLSDDDKDDDVEADGNERNLNVLKQLTAHKAYDPAEKELVEGEENKHKSKKEIMEEVISKSKYFKAQKAKDKEENVELMEELDKTFSSLVQSQALISLTEPGKMNALKALVNKGIPKEQLKNDEKRLENLKQEQPDSYDKLVKEMALDMRARPSDRTKTPEEIAQEERERLQLLEEERQKRMLAPEDISDEENEDSEKVSIPRSKSISGDDLGDSFSLEEDRKDKRGWVDEVLARKDTTESEDEYSSENSGKDEDDESSDEDDDAGEQAVSLKDWEQSDDENIDTDLEDEEGDENNEVNESDNSDDGKNMESSGSKKLNNAFSEEIKINDKKSSDVKKKIQRDIPFLIEAPMSLEEFCALVKNCSNSDMVEVINRIRATSAIKLAAENRKKMQVFYGVLLQYFAVSANQVPLNFELLNLLVKPLMEISVEIPYFAAICARQRILRTRTQFCEEVKNPEKSCWPSLKTLFLLRLWSMIFPCSDFRHVVITPAIMLMCEYLMRCPIKSGRDIAIGSFLCSMVLNVCRQSKKLCPEVIIFVRTLLMAAKDRKTASSEEDYEFYHLMENKALSSLLCIRESVNDVEPMNFLTVMSMPEDSSFFSSDEFRCSVLVTLIETLEGFINIYEELNSFPEIFMPIATLLLELAQQQNKPIALQEKLKNVAQLIKKKADEYYTLRRPLQMQKKKPVPIKLLNPKFEENFVKGRDYDPDRERAERKKLKKLVQREAKGAARELRKDNYYLSQVKEKEKQRLEEERAEKYGKARAFLQEQEHAFKSGQLGKGKGGKRKR